MPDLFAGIERGITQRLLASAELLSIVGERIYADIAPEDPHGNVNYPLVLFSQVMGDYSNDSPRDNATCRYRVVCVATDTATAVRGAEAVFNALQDKPLDVPGWACYWIRADKAFARAEREEKTTYFRRGADYFMRFDRA
jgi:hypothetical protein